MGVNLGNHWESSDLRLLSFVCLSKQIGSNNPWIFSYNGSCILKSGHTNGTPATINLTDLNPRENSERFKHNQFYIQHGIIAFFFLFKFLSIMHVMKETKWKHKKNYKKEAYIIIEIQMRKTIYLMENCRDEKWNQNGDFLQGSK